ncbi:hypothetical protein KQX54_011108 [Cotesia glomerata]|uniref:Uncharacterized protein n=1 Tax=Cotesia glomerata TaxID=32391 RepID=A0AAV7ID11_COTGL|nr:hypothetical protein KQX54_011108 [Cotesia glomerata]
MDQILKEITALRNKKSLKHEELKNKLESNLIKDQAAFTRLEEGLNQLSKEISGTKSELSKRISVLEANTIKIDQVEGLRNLVETLEKQPITNPSTDGPLNKKISFLTYAWSIEADALVPLNRKSLANFQPLMDFQEEPLEN